MKSSATFELFRSKSFLLLAALIFVIASCARSNEGLKAYSTDSLDISAPLIPENNLSDSSTYKGIPVARIKDRFTTDSSEVYIDLNIQILDQNPNITDHLLSFAIRNLSESGFISTPDSLISSKFNLPDYRSESTQEILNKFSGFVSKEFYARLPEILGYGPGYNMSIIIYPVFLKDDYVTYYKYAYYYTGGAHGNDTKSLQTFNIKTGKALDVEDIILSDKYERFREAVVNHMAASYPIYEGIKTAKEYLDSLNNWRGSTLPAVSGEEITPDSKERITVKNFPIRAIGINDTGVVLSYEKYFLTPGVNGCPIIVIPYDEIRDCIKPPFNSFPSEKHR